MKRKYIISSMEAGLVLLVASSIFFIGQSFVNKKNHLSQQLRAKNITEINLLKQENEKQPKESDSNIGDPNAWKNYVNNDLGISFQYPNSWGDMQVRNNDYTTGSEHLKWPDVYSGKSVDILFSKPGVYISLASLDFKAFWFDGYNGGKDLSAGCSSLKESYKKEFCKEITVAGQKTYSYYQNYNLECSGDVARYFLPLNLPQKSSPYRGLTIAFYIYDFPIDTSDFSDPCGRPEQNVKANLQAIYDRKNLSSSTMQFLGDFDKFLASLKFLE